MKLTAFTLCLRLSSELQGEQDMILFEYRTKFSDELALWREKDGRFSIYINMQFCLVHLPQLTSFQTHLCVTWESKSGLTTFYVDGKRSIPKVVQKDYILHADGIFTLGQDADNIADLLNKKPLDISQSFIGEITDVNMWDYVLPQRVIEDLHCGKNVSPGTIFDWDTIRFEVEGEVMVID